MRCDFTGSQDTDNGKIVIDGYIDILSKTDEIHTDVRGILNVHDSKNRSHEFTGNFTQLLLGYFPKLALYTDNGLGEKFYYEFDDAEVHGRTMKYNGFYCPLIKENIARLASLLKPEHPKDVSIELILENEDSIQFLKK